MIQTVIDNLLARRVNLALIATYITLLRYRFAMTENQNRKNDQESDNRLPTGEWNGFYLESHRSGRGWMSMYLAFADGRINGEGTDYVGPWVATGSYDLDTGLCSWVKRYLGMHTVSYSGKVSGDGIRGDWQLKSASGPFHIWPRGMNNNNELYLKHDMDLPVDGSFADSFSDSLTEQLEPELV